MKDAERGTGPKRLELKYLYTELKYLKDPVKLADHIRHVLHANDEEKAQALVRLSSRAMANTVSWNHLIDWQMKHGKTKSALETYNEMKKRAQKPDTVTYTLLLRGLGNYAYYPGSLGRALSLYHGMFGPNSKVQPNITHVNAVLKVCSRANDMNSLWDIVSKLPERGPMAADAWTFSTLFNYMRYQTLTASQSAPEEETAARREEMIVKGRQMWGVIVARWRAGDMKIDEDVMCAMARLLLTGSRPRDWDDVLSLVSQATQIPRLLPRLAGGEGQQALAAPTEERQTSNPLGSLSKPAETSPEFSAVKPDASKASGGRRPPSAFYVAPTKLTLQIIIEACSKLSAKSAARNYWDLLTDANSYGIIPDVLCVNAFLRLLRFSRSSAEAVEMVTELMPIWKVKPNKSSYRLAMRACVRDSQNPNAMDLATNLLDKMQSTLPEPDIQVLDMFVELAMASKNPQDVARAAERLKRLDPTIHNLRSFLSFGPVSSGNNDPKKLTNAARTEGIEFFQRMIACYDRILGTVGGLTPEKKQDVVAKRSKLAAFVTRYRNKWAPKMGQKKWGPATEADGTVHSSNKMRKRIMSPGVRDVEGTGRSPLDTDEDQDELDRKDDEQAMTGSGIDNLEKSFGDGSQDNPSRPSRRRPGVAGKVDRLKQQRTSGAQKQFS